MSTNHLIETDQQNGVTLLWIANPSVLDRLLIHELGDQLIEYIDRHKPEKLLINFERVTFCSSEFIGGLIRARRRVLEYGGQMKLCSMNKNVHRVFHITHLEGALFEIYDTPQEAIAAFC